MRRLGILLCCILVLTGCGQREHAKVNPAVPSEAERAEPAISYTEETRDIAVSEVAGEAVSPDGRYQVMLMKSRSEDAYAPDTVLVWDTAEHLIRWQGTGFLNQSVCWSFDGTYLALAQSARTYERVLLIETENWTEWEFTMPDGSAIPEYTFLPEDWGTWTEDNVLRLMIGRGGDAGERRTYRCTLQMEDGKLAGSVVATEKILGENFDFNHNGIFETVTLEGNAGEESTFWVLRVTEDGQELWADSAALAHAGWNSLFVCEIDGEDYLMRYLPGMWQGFANYQYQLFMLGESGEELVLAQNQVSFDEVYVSQIHTPFNREGIADFLWEVRSYLVNSKLLLSTEDGELQLGETGIALKYYPFGRTYEDLMSLNSREAITEALRRYEEHIKLDQGIS